MYFPLFLGFVVGVILVRASENTFDSSLDVEWKNWKLQYNRHYIEGEETNRRMIWESAMSYIEQHNREYAMGKHTFTVGINQFGDLTNEEFNKLMNGFLINEGESSIAKVEECDGFDETNENDLKLPESFDWRKKGVVTPIKNQGQCRSCWAFSATGALEGQMGKRGKLISLSEQNLLDCDLQSFGCNGGYMESAFDCIQKEGGINSEKVYPYTAMKSDCRFRRDKVVAKVRKYCTLRKNETALAKGVTKVGPISIAINARLESFQYYNGGIYYDPQCSNQNVNHAMLAIGYGIEDGDNYWLIKNRYVP
ncbi:cathepsin L1-like [Amblyraja radiata]|uniref:cathepsin L1-like n=1 Tax=Amblyraja radiata TaxID=386614 RepID=UPI001403947E|nr:cathepsin L1-like [Amblyraja radiata]